MWPNALDYSCISVVGNSSAHVTSLINLISPATAKHSKIVGPTSPLLVLLVVGSSSLCRHGAMFLSSNSYHNYSICACVHLFISPCCCVAH
jgi:hypothetical protein